MDATRLRSLIPCDSVQVVAILFPARSGDGLRGVAILMVLVCHYWFGPDISQASPSSLHVFGFRIFASGVDLFFVLSGFLIGGMLLDRRDSPAYFRVFYARRIVRIFPVYDASYSSQPYSASA